MKSKRGAVKRLKVTGSGKIKRFHAFSSHILTKKTRKRKRNLKKSSLISKADQKRMREIILV